ncbi:hypothetical protein M8J76_004783 [Diaphorina citri]|nr:hypothetical protein M8J76_004783 [Diaphorina citri]
MSEIVLPAPADQVTSSTFNHQRTNHFARFIQPSAQPLLAESLGILRLISSSWGCPDIMAWPAPSGNLTVPT